MHSTKKPKTNDTEGQPRDATLETVDAILDRGVLLDGFRRVSVFGIELFTVDGPTRVRHAQPRSDESNGSR